uniref:Phospholipid/glycerol acyltransferase domain-containing protein n=1 Tax=viral metagenome TaxID=1070528 RepID=A0A6C0EJI8_9ZZZZ
MFYTKTDVMRIKWYINYISFGNSISKTIKAYDNIIINNPIHIKKEKFNLILMNHNSILDNFILSKLLENSDFTWNDLRTVSRISSRKIQNSTLKLHGSLLVSQNLKNDVSTFRTIRNKWKTSKDTVQIILFPEGIIYQESTYNSQTAVSKDKYKNLLSPKIGIYNILLENFKDEIRYIYDITAVYISNGERVLGELAILDALTKNTLKIYVDIKEYKLEDIVYNDNWLFERWKEKDLWIENTLMCPK